MNNGLDIHDSLNVCHRANCEGHWGALSDSLVTSKYVGSVPLTKLKIYVNIQTETSGTCKESKHVRNEPGKDTTGSRPVSGHIKTVTLYWLTHDVS